MSKIIYQIYSGTPNFTAHLFPSGIAEDQIHSEYGEYFFDNLPPGYYVISITDANGCVAVQEVNSGVTEIYKASFTNYACQLRDTDVSTTTTTATKPNSRKVLKKATHIIIGDSEDEGNLYTMYMYVNYTHKMTAQFMNGRYGFPYWGTYAILKGYESNYPMDGDTVYVNIDVSSNNSCYAGPTPAKQFNPSLGHKIQYLISKNDYTVADLQTVLSQVTTIGNVELNTNPKWCGDKMYTGSFVLETFADADTYLYIIEDYRDTIATTTTTTPVTTTTTTTCDNIASLSATKLYETATTVSVLWTVNLSKPSMDNPTVTIPLTVTAASGTGTQSEDVIIYLNETYGSTMVIYNKTAGAYNATAQFGELTACYSAANTGTIAIPALGATTTTTTTSTTISTTTTTQAPTTTTTQKPCMQVQLVSNDNDSAIFHLTYCGGLTDIVTVISATPQLHCVLEATPLTGNGLINYLNSCNLTTTTTTTTTSTTTTTIYVPTTTTTSTTTTTIPINTACWGLIYNGYVASDSRNIANTGWKVPSSSDVDTLIAYCGGTSVVGGKLKQTGEVYWNGNVGATNEFGFNGRGGGYRQTSGLFAEQRLSSQIWLSDFFGGGTPRIGRLYTTESTYGDCVSCCGSYPKEGKQIRLIKISTTLTHGQTGIYIGNDGKGYNTICIGTQEWISSDLAETKFRDGSDIPNVTDNTAWSALSTPALCAYNNDWSNICNTIIPVTTTTTSTTTTSTTTSTTTTTIRELPTVETIVPNNITQNSAKSGGIITTNGSYTIATRGLCWSIGNPPLTIDIHTTNTTEDTPYHIDMYNLAPNTTYYVRAYLIMSTGELVYGNVLSFMTLATTTTTSTSTTSTTRNMITTTTTTVGAGVLGTITLDKIDKILYNQARGRSTISISGTLPIHQRGIVVAKWKGTPYAVPVPTISDMLFISTTTNTGSEFLNLTGLEGNSIYEARAFMINAAGLTYSNQLSFQTPIPEIFVPNGFSPNGDGVHDLFQVFALEYYTDNQMSIFDQNGNLIYSSTNYHLVANMWNGRYENTGNMVPTGTYYYVLKVNGKTHNKGYVFVSY